MAHLWTLLLPLAAALTYVGGALALKRSTELGIGLWRATVVSNLLVAVAFQVLLVFPGTWPAWSLWWQPLLVALLFLSGQIWTLVSLQRGDVSIATPVLGVKILFVAAFSTWLLAEGVTWQLWLAAGLSAAAIASLNHSGARRAGARVGGTIATAGAAAVSYALFDVLVQKWSPAWGLGRFLPVTMALMGVFSCGLLPLVSSSWREPPAVAWRWLGWGGGLFALQSILIVSSIAHFGQATAANVIYSSRGLWSVVVVACWGHWFHSAEQRLGSSVLRWRLTGATLLLVAVALVLI